jgi:hypothetical protein
MIISHKTQGLYSLDIFNIDKECILSFLNTNFNTKIVEKMTIFRGEVERCDITKKWLPKTYNVYDEALFEVDFLVTEKERDYILYMFEDEIYDSLNSLNSLFGKEKSLFIVEPFKDLKLTLNKIIISIKVIKNKN